MRNNVTRRDAVMLFGGLALSTLTACGTSMKSSSVATSDDSEEMESQELESSSSYTSGGAASKGSGIVIGDPSIGSSDATIRLRMVDPVTGSASDFRAFPFKVGELFISGRYTARGLPWRKSFNSDFTNMCVKTDQSTAYDPYHVGWIDTSGAFFDVTKRVVAQQGDFGGVINHRSASFATEGYFYYEDYQNSTVLRVLVDNVSETSAEELATRYKAEVYYAASDGTISEGAVYSPDDSHVCWFSGISDWVDNEHYISDEGQYCEGVPIASTKDTVHMGTKGKALHDLIPQVKGRESYNFIVSPGGSQVAFLSCLETDPIATLFVVPIEGGEPKKISDLAFEKGAKTILDWI